MNRTLAYLTAADARVERRIDNLEAEVKASFERAKAVETAEFDRRVTIYVQADELASQRERAQRVRSRIDELLA